MTTFPIIDPKTLRAISEKNQQRLELERLQNQIKEKEDFERMLDTLVFELENEVKERAYQGETHFYEIYHLNTRNLKVQSGYQLCKLIETVADIFRELGYKALYHEYSESWFRRSGRLCSLWIQW